MKQRSKRYVDAILNGPHEDGWLCPCNDTEWADYDMLVLFLILKVLTLYKELTSDPRKYENLSTDSPPHFLKHGRRWVRLKGNGLFLTAVQICV